MNQPRTIRKAGAFGVYAVRKPLKGFFRTLALQRTHTPKAPLELYGNTKTSFRTKSRLDELHGPALSKTEQTKSQKKQKNV